MKVIKKLWLYALAFLALGSSCEKEVTSPDLSGCFEGVAIVGACPSILVVQVKNIQIGEPWEFNGKSYSNVISIENTHIVPDGLDLKYGDTFYFTLDIEASKNGANCTKQVPCNDAMVMNFPNKKYCIKSISTQNCPDIHAD
ncbi:MAG: hypothetical protein HC819_25145 [Cyclobacteriaceae bacterium]|nr:hypothetical protein [Cyclobacteriaceae bacterium]